MLDVENLISGLEQVVVRHLHLRHAFTNHLAGRVLIVLAETPDIQERESAAIQYWEGGGGELGIEMSVEHTAVYFQSLPFQQSEEQKHCSMMVPFN